MEMSIMSSSPKPETPEYLMTPLTYNDSVISTSPPPSPTSLAEYGRLKEEYTNSGVSHTRQSLLKRIVNKGEFIKKEEFGKCY